jgi:plastocyanin
MILSFNDIPKEEVEIDQVGCIYVPRVVAARVGQKVTYINSDPIYHNIRSYSKKNRKFNKGMPTKGQRITRVFKKPEIPFQTKCSVHPWMGVYVAVFDHPFFDVTDKNGEFEINNLPAGTYTLEAWHEVYGVMKKEFTVSENEKLNLEIRFKSNLGKI